MPWRDTTPIEEKARLVLLARSDRFTITELCEQFGISRKTAYKHLGRFAAEGMKGLGRLSSLNLWWIEQGIQIDFTRPGKPQDNGSHERMHRDLQAGATQPPSVNLRAQQRRFERWQYTFNDERPHEALEQQTPAGAWKGAILYHCGRWTLKCEMDA